MKDANVLWAPIHFVAVTVGFGEAPSMEPEPYDPVSRFDKRRIVGMTQGARKRKWAKDFDALSPEERIGKPGWYAASSLREYGVIRNLGRIRPCRLCHGPAGCAECRAGHGPEFSCAFCEPCGTRPKRNRTKHTPCDGSGVLPARKARKVR